MIEAALEAITIIFTFERLLWILAGVLMGLVLGFIPGLGGVVGMSLLLPFIFGMDPYSGIALLVGMFCVTQTGDSFPAVLMGIPGTSGGASTIMDGYPMARQGQAGRALGAAFLASMFGGIFGGVVLFLSIPIARPLVLSFGSPELFMICLIGLSLVAILSKGAAIKGILVGLLGMMVSTIGLAPSTTDLRFTFDSLYLYNGIGLVLVALGIFAIPELLELFVEDKQISKKAATVEGGVFQGMKDTMRNIPLVLQGSAVGTLLGMLPGIGGSVINWVVYGVSANTVRKNNRFGKGDVRGVIGPEAGQNSTEGGQMIPTLMFGIPGGAGTAIMLGGLILLGIQPGPSMVEPENLPIILTVVGTLVVANIMGTTLSLSLVKPISKLTQLPVRRIAPFLIAVIVLAAYQTNYSWGDLFVLIAFGCIAFVLKQLQWPRVPLLIGFVLGTPAERYFSVSMSRYGLDWLTRPGVLIMMAILVLSIGLALWQQKKVERVVDEGAAHVARARDYGAYVDTTESEGSTERTLRSDNRSMSAERSTAGDRGSDPE